MMSNNKSQSENYTKSSKNKNYSRGDHHYTQDKERLKIAKEKFRITREKNREKLKPIFKLNKLKKDKALKEKIEKSEILSKVETFNLLKDDQYKKYMGKSGNLKMSSVNPSLYKSVLYHTNEYEKFCAGKTYFSCRLQIIGIFNYNIDRNYFCKCGQRLNYEKSKQIFTYRGFCRKCLIVPSSKEWFKYKYQDKWEEEYKNFFNREDIKYKNRLRARKAIENKINRGVRGFINKGINEDKILNFFETTLNIKIDRDYHVLGYHPDGYCHETNTIYEVYEKYHLYKDKMIYDIRRQKEITDHLKCNFVIIYDDRSQDDISKLKIEKYEIK
jgi:hypothetical protein